MSVRTAIPAALATVAAIAVAVASVLVGHIASAPPVAPVPPDAAYVQALDVAMGLSAPDAQQWARDVTVGGQICYMLAHGWNEAGVVGNMLTWPTNRYSQSQLAVAVHVTRLELCGQHT